MTALLGLPVGYEWVILLVVALLLFGGTRIAGMGKGAGRAIREFKEELKAPSPVEAAQPQQVEAAEPHQVEAGKTEPVNEPLPEALDVEVLPPVSRAEA